MRKTMFIMLMAFMMTISSVLFLCEVDKVYAAETHHSQSDAINWIKARGNECWWEDVDGGYGCQCVDLIQKYYLWFGYARLSGNAYEYKSGRIPRGSGWYYSNTPIPGAVFVKDADGTYPYGHVGLVYAVDNSKIYTVETNIRSPYDGGNNAGARYSEHPRSGYAATFICPDFPSPDTPKPAVDIKTSVYSIRSAINNNLVLDVADGKTTNGTNIQTYNYHGGPEQRFNIVRENGYYLIKPQCSNLLLDTAGNSDQSGANIIQWEATGAHGQHWEFVDAGGGYYYIRNWRGTYLDVTDGINAKQVNIQACRFNGSAAQKWKLVHETRNISDGYYEIRSTKDNGLALDIADASNDKGANLQLYKYHGGWSQVFRITNDNGSYMIQPLCSNLFLETAGDSDVSGANLQQWNDDGKNGKRFKFIPTGTNDYYIRSNLGNFVDITDGIVASQTNIQSCRFNGSLAQSWKLVKIDPLRFKPETPQTKVNGTKGRVEIQWQSVDHAHYKHIYDVRIYNNSTASGSYYKVFWGIRGTSCSINLPKGVYSVTVAAVYDRDYAIYSDARSVAFQVDSSGRVSYLQTKQNQKTNPLAIKGKTATVKYKKLKKRTQTIKRTKAITVTRPQGKLTYKKVSVTYTKAKSAKMSKKALKKYKKRAAKKITINAKTGKVTVKKGLKKGTYKVKVKVRAAGNANYKASAWKTVTFKIKIK